MQRVKSMFTPPVRKMINFTYIKNRTLFLYLIIPLGNKSLIIIYKLLKAL